MMRGRPAGPSVRRVNAELLGIEVMVAAVVWIIAIPAAFYFVGPAVGVAVILGGLALLAWWLTSVIRGSTRDADQP